MKYTILIITLLSAFSCNLFKKSYKVKKDKSVVNYANTITASELKKHLSVIASDEYEGRETGKKGQKMTAEYLKKEFIKDGVGPGNKGSYLQEFPLIETSKPEATIQIHNRRFSFLEDFYFFQSYANIEDFMIETSEIYPIGDGIIDGEKNDYGKKDLTGKTVIIRVESPEKFKNWDWKRKLEKAKERGVKRVFFTSKNFERNQERLTHFLSKSSLKLKMDNQKKTNFIPFFFISQKLEMELLSETNQEDKNVLEKYPLYNKVELNYISHSKTIYSTNVLGFIEGSDPTLKEEVVIITAHYDHLGIKDGLVYNGADDDGTGTVALLEIAEAFQKAKNEGNGPKRSILIMPVSGEEKGLLGSKYYSENPIFPLKNTIVDLNIDMIGRMDEHHTDSNYVYIIGADKISQELHNINEATNKTYTKMELDYTFNDENDPNRFYYRSDHYNFAQKGIPVIFYFSGVHEDYHKHTDEINKIMFNKVEKITRLVFYTAWEVANKPTRLTLNKS